MVETIFPSSPNLYLSRIISVREDGSVAYGSLRNIFILKNENNKMHPILLREAHEQRVTSVVFSPANCINKFLNLILSSSDDGYVKLWNIETLLPFSGHKSHWDREETVSVKIVCADWSQYNPQFIVSAAENSTIVLWDVIGNFTIRYYFQKLNPTVIACSFHDEKIVACGSMSGLVYIIKLVKKGEIMYKFRGHDKEVQALSWCPVKENCDISKQFPLASSCQEKEVYIWRTADGGCEAKIPLPKNVLSKSMEQRKWEPSINFVPLFWVDSYTLYSGTKYGELISCNLKDLLSIDTKNVCMTEKQFNRKTSCCWKLVHSLHSNIVVAITGLHNQNKANLKDDYSNKFPNGTSENHTLSDNSADVEESLSPGKGNLIWTIGKDQRLIAVERNSQPGQSRFNFHTLNGHPYFFEASPHDPNKIAIAGGDGKIRLWSSARSSGHTRIYWQNIKGRVYSLAWHPTREGRLAFGTSEGRIGFLEMYTLKQPTNFKVNHHGVVYRVSWGPPFCENGEISPPEKQEFFLYSLGNNKIFLHDPTKIYSEPLSLTKVIDIPCKKFSDLCWKPDFSLLAVGCGNGNVYLLQPPKLTICEILGCKKYIQSLTWHPVSTTTDIDCSNFQGYLTFGSTDNDAVLKVYNCTVKGTKCEVDEIASLRGHSGYVQAVSWSPHVAGRLISAGADFSVRIWDVTKNTQISKFVISQSILPLFCSWNPVDPEILIAGFADRFMVSWRISNESSKSPLVKDVKFNKGKNNEFTESLKSSETVAMDGGRVDIESQKPELINFSLATQGPKTCKESKMFAKAWKSDKDPFLHCYELLKRNEIGLDDESDILPLLGSENQFTEFLNSEAESSQKSNKWNEYYEICLWRGNLNAVLEEKIKTGHLDDFLVSLAPLVSPRLWKEACRSYAKSLVEKNSHRKAACYLMAIHEVRGAIDLLLKENLYLEAISIARCRLPKSDPVYTEAIRKYADWLTKTGSYLKACECYIFLKEFAEAAYVLGKKNNVDYLSLAALASRKAGLDDLEKEYAFGALLMCLESNNWDLATRIYCDHQNLKELSVLCIIHHEINRLDLGEVILEKDLLNHLRELIGIHGDSNIYAALEYIYDRNFIYFDKKKLHVTLARELALACCAVERETVLAHIIKSMNVATRWMNKSNDIESPLYKLCSWLCLNEYLAEGSIFSLNDSNTKPKITSLRAFLCQGLVEYLDTAYGQNKEDLFDKLLDMELILMELVNDALDSQTFIYFKNQLDVIICEKAISEAYRKKNEMINGKLDSCSEKIGSGVDNTFQESEEKANREKESDKTDNDLNELITSEKEKLNRLKAELKDFENTRIFAPNPALICCILKRVSDAFRSSQCKLKSIVEEKWKELEKI